MVSNCDAAATTSPSQQPSASEEALFRPAAAQPEAAQAPQAPTPPGCGAPPSALPRPRRAARGDKELHNPARWAFAAEAA